MITDTHPISEPESNETRDRGAALEKIPTGIRGLDEITFGGLPKGRPTLVCGGPGCGKSLLAVEFLVRGILEHGEPGALLAFEETAEDLAKDMASLGFDLHGLQAQGKLAVDYVHVDRIHAREAGSYDLEALFIRLQAAVESVGAKRLAIDTLEAVFGGFSDEALLRGEILRIFRWIKDRGLTAVITAERGEGPMTRQGLEEYVSDCVLMLDHRVSGNVATRKLRVAKYRGSRHGTNEYPFLIETGGIAVLPITSLGLEHQASEERVPSGIPRLDNMLEGRGFYRGSTILVSGTAGSGKTSIANSFAHASCRRGERCLYLAFEESGSQIKRNMRSIGLDLQPLEERGLLRYDASRPTAHGLEVHLTRIHRLIAEFKPAVIVVDPVTNLLSQGNPSEVNALLLRLIDYLKGRQITAMFLSLSKGSQESLEATEIGISSQIDTWLLLRDIESSGERNRAIYVLKSRGMAHSNQLREFTLSPAGIELKDVYAGPSGVVTGSARMALEARERAEAAALEAEIESRRLRLERMRKSMEARVAELEEEFQLEEQEALRTIDLRRRIQKRLRDDRSEMARFRHADLDSIGSAEGNGHA